MKSMPLLSAILIFLLAACGPSAAPATNPPVVENSASSSGSSATTGTAINVSNFTFSPKEITVPVGTTITWTNLDSAAHTIVADDGTWKSESLGQGDTYSHTFSSAGVFTYKCGIHASMTGKITVTP